MSYPNHTTIDFVLMGKYFSGEASPEEAMAVDNWLLASEDNRKQFEQLFGAWQQGAQQAAHRLPDSQTLWEEITRAAPQPPVIVVRRVSNTRWLAGIAALLLLAVGVAAFYWVFREKGPDALPYMARQAGENILRDTLPDGTVVIQNSRSLLKYPASYNGRSREAGLEGEAWFDVQHNPAKPFIIQAGDVRVKVLGTSFNIRQSDSAIETAVKTGKVMMYNSADTIFVEAGQKGIYHVKSHVFSALGRYDENDLGYATGVFNFENASLEQIAARIEKAYGVKVIFRSERIKHFAMTTSFDRNTIQYIFDVISVTLNVQYEIDHKTIYISERGRR